MRSPGRVPSAHVDPFTRENLPPRERWPEMDYAALPELAAYPDRINAAAFLVDHHVASGAGPRVAIRYGEGTWTYAELQARANRLARVLVEDLGVQPGNRVLLRAPNTPMLVAAWLAVVKAGGVCVATMPLLRSRELAFIVEKAQVRHALCDVGLLAELRLAQERAPGLKTIACFSAEGAGSDPAADLDAALGRKAADFTAVDTAADDVAIIMFTSGTTGQPKGAMHFHRDLLAMCDTFARYVARAHADEIYFGTPPIPFAYGLGGLLCFPFRFGASVAFPTERATPEVLLALLERHRGTTLYSSPAMYRMLAEAASSHDLRSLRTCVSAGETLPLPTFEAFRRATGVAIIDGLGSTEMTHIFVATRPEEIRPGATGRAVPGYEARVIDEEGRPLPAGELGQLAVRGPTGCRYLADPDRQAAYVRRGWNLPGDVYKTDPQGYFWYQARADDMINTAGFKVAGPEVEAVLLDHPSVKECAVVGLPDPERGQIVAAFVVARDPAAAGDRLRQELQEFVKKEIAVYKYPRAVTFLTELPRTETGKLQRFKLREAVSGSSIG
jgi:2-aminobenzoate-CoA ligase